MEYKKAEDWIPSDGFKLEDNALEAVKSDFNTLVVAGPGAGKTELLAQRACFLLETNTCKYPQKILAISFKRDAARNLKERVVERCGEEIARRFESLTFDAFAKQILDRFRNALSDGYKLKGEYDIFFNENQIIDYYKYFDKDFTNSHSKEKLLEFHHRTLPITGVHKATVLKKKVWNYLLNQDNSQLNFKMIMRLSELIISVNPIIKNYLQKTYSFVFLDEFQDTTFIQYDFLNRCFPDGTSALTAVGDNKQRIMAWAGANPEIFDIFQDEYSAKYLPLIMNFRSAPNLVALQNYLVQHLMKKTETVTPSDKWGLDEGEASVWVYDNTNEEKEHLLKQVQTWISKDNLKPGDICILVKQQLSVYAGELIDYFNQNGIKARDESIIQDLITEDVIRYIINVLIYTCDKKASNSKSEIINFLGNINTEFEDENLLILEQKFNEFVKGLKTKLKSKITIDLVKAITPDILEFADIDRVKAVYPSYRTPKYLDDLLCKLHNEISISLDGNATLKNALETLLGKDSLPVMTIHKSKGLEYHSVIFVGLEDNAFWSYERQPDEDKCAFFVALSRAMERVVITISKNRKNKWGQDKPQSTKKIQEVVTELQKSKLIKIEAICSAKKDKKKV